MKSRLDRFQWELLQYTVKTTLNCLLSSTYIPGFNCSCKHVGHTMCSCCPPTCLSFIISFFSSSVFWKNQFFLSLFFRSFFHFLSFSPQTNSERDGRASAELWTYLGGCSAPYINVCLLFFVYFILNFGPYP